jgi:hypothetical protein
VRKRFKHLSRILIARLAHQSAGIAKCCVQIIPRGAISVGIGTNL